MALTFRNGDDAVLRKRRLIVVDIDHPDAERSRPGQLRIPLIRRDYRQPVLLAYLPIQHDVGSNYAAVRRAYGERVVRIPVHDMIQNSTVHPLIRVARRELRQISIRFLSFPTGRKFLLFFFFYFRFFSFLFTFTTKSPFTFPSKTVAEY